MRYLDIDDIPTEYDDLYRFAAETKGSECDLLNFLELIQSRLQLSDCELALKMSDCISNKINKRV